MRLNFPKSGRRCAANRGLTLVEAIAGICLMGTLLASILIADGKLRRQDYRAQLRVDACRAADQVLSKFWDSYDSFPRNSSGEISGWQGWTWRTATVTNTQANQLDAAVVELSIFPPKEAQAAASVQIVLPSKGSK